MKRPLLALAALLISAPLVSAQTGGVRGKILDDKGNPVEAAAVMMEFQGGVTLKFENKTNKKGEFMQIGLRPGSWKFTYTKEGFQTFASPYRVALGDATVLPEVKLVSAKAAAAAAMGGGEELQKNFGEAVTKLQAGDFDGAIAAFDALILKNPSLAEAYYNKGFALYQKKDYAAAETTLKRALEVKSDYSDARVLLSNIYSAQGLKDKAVEVLNGDDPSTLFDRGYELLQQGKYEEANLILTKLNLDQMKESQEFVLLMTRVYALLASKKYEEANALMLDATKIKPFKIRPSDPKQLFNLGLALLNSGQNAEAAEAFARAEKADPSNPEVQYYLGTAALNAGKTDECVARLEKYLSMGPKSEQNKATAQGLIAALKKK
jgi:tetratricopeptide (TPR) repeat protein